MMKSAATCSRERKKTMSEKVLFVDDEPNVLDGIRRQLRKNFSVETALGPVEGLRAINKKGPFAVVVSDIRMPLIDGIKFLTRVREIAPESVRMVLTGNADIDNAIKAVNSGHVFRFMTKPCPAEALIEVVQAGIEQYRLIRSEKEVLEQTLKGSIRVLTEIISMLDPEAFGRASRIKRYAVEIAVDMGMNDLWKIETAALLSQIGFAILPGLSIENLYNKADLSPAEKDLLARHPEVAFNLLRHIPRMEDVAAIIRDQDAPPDALSDGQETPGQPDGARMAAVILKTVSDFDLYAAKEKNPESALERLAANPERYDPRVIESLKKIVARREKYETREVGVGGLEAGMIIREEVRTMNGLLLIAKGQEVGYVTIERLKNYARSDQGVQEPIHVHAPVLMI